MDNDDTSPSSSGLGLPSSSRLAPSSNGEAGIEATQPTEPVEDPEPNQSSSSDTPDFSETIINAVKIYSSLPSSSGIPPHRLPTASPSTPTPSSNVEAVLEEDTPIQPTEQSDLIVVEDSQSSSPDTSDTPPSSGTIMKAVSSASSIPPHRLHPSFRLKPCSSLLKKGTTPKPTLSSTSDFMTPGPSTSNVNLPTQPSNLFKSLSKNNGNAGTDFPNHPQPTRYVVKPPSNPSGTPTKKRTPKNNAAPPTPPQKSVEPVSGGCIFDYSPNMDAKIERLLELAAEQRQQPEQVEPPKPRAYQKPAVYPKPPNATTYASPEVEKHLLEKKKRIDERARNPPPVEPKRLPGVAEKTDIAPDMDVSSAMSSEDEPSTSAPRSQRPKKSTKSKTSENGYAAFLNSITNFPPGLEKTIGLGKKVKETPPKVVPKPSYMVETIPATIKRPAEPIVIGPVILSEPPPSRPELAQVKSEELNQYLACMTSIAGKIKFPLSLKQIVRRYKSSKRPIIRNLLEKIPHYNKLIPSSSMGGPMKVRLMFLTQTPVPESTKEKLSEFKFNLDDEEKIIEVQGEDLHLNRVKSQQANVLAEVNLSDTEEEVRVPDVVVLSDSDDDLPAADHFDDYDMAQAGGYTHGDVEGEEEVGAEPVVKKADLRLEEVATKIPEVNQEEPAEVDSEDTMTQVEKRKSTLLWESIVRLITLKARRSSVFLEWNLVYNEIKEDYPGVKDTAAEALDRIKKYVFLCPLKWRNVTDRYFILYVYRLKHSKEEQQQLKGVGTAKFDKNGRLVELCSRDKKVQFGVINNSTIMNHLKELAATLRETKSFESLAEMFLEWRCRDDSQPPIEINYLIEKYKEVAMLIQSYNTLSLITRIRMLWITGTRINPVFKNKLRASGKVEFRNGFVWKFKTFRLGEEFDSSVKKFNMEKKGKEREEEEDDGDYGDPGLEDEMDYVSDAVWDDNHEVSSNSTRAEEPIPERSEESSPPVPSVPELGQEKDLIGEVDEDPMLEASDALPTEERSEQSTPPALSDPKLGTSDAVPAEEKTPERSEESSPPAPSVLELNQEKESIGEANEDQMTEASEAIPTEEESEQSTPPALSDPKLGQEKVSIDEDPLLNTSDAILAEERTPDRSEESSPPVPTTPIEEKVSEDTQQSSSQVSPTSEKGSLEKVASGPSKAVDQEEEMIPRSSQEAASSVPASDLLRHFPAAEETPGSSGSIPSTSDAVPVEETTSEKSEESSSPVPSTPIEEKAPEDTQQSSSQDSPTSEMRSLEEITSGISATADREEGQTVPKGSQESAIRAPPSTLWRQQEEGPSFQGSAVEDTPQSSSSTPSTSDPEQDFAPPNQNYQIPKEASEPGYEGEGLKWDLMAFGAGAYIPEPSGQAPSTSGVDSTHQNTVTCNLDRVITVPVEEVREKALEPQVFHPTSSIFGSFDPIRRLPNDNTTSSNISKATVTDTPAQSSPQKSRRSQNPSSTETLASISNISVDASTNGSTLLSPVQHPQVNPQVVVEASTMSSLEGQSVPITKGRNSGIEVVPSKNVGTDSNTSRKSTHNPLNRMSTMINSIPTTSGDAPQTSKIDPAIQRLLDSGFFKNTTSSKSAVNNRPSTSSQVSVTSTPQSSTSQPSCPLLTAALEERAARRRARNSGRGIKRAREDADNVQLPSTPNPHVQKMSQLSLTSTQQSPAKNPTMPNFLPFPPQAQLAGFAPHLFPFFQPNQTPNLPLLMPTVPLKTAQKRGRVSTGNPVVPEKKARQEVEQPGDSLLMKLLMEPSTGTYSGPSVAPKPAAAPSRIQIQAPGPSTSAVKSSEPNDIAKEKCEAIMKELGKDLARWEQEDGQLKSKMPVNYRSKYDVLIGRIEYYVCEFYELLLMSNISKDQEKENSMTMMQVLTMINGESQVKSMGFKEYLNGHPKSEVLYDKMWRVYDLLKDPNEKSNKEELKKCMDTLFEILF